MRQFLNQDDIYSYPLELSMNIYNKRNTVKTLHAAEHRPTGESMKRTAVSNIIRFCSSKDSPSVFFVINELIVGVQVINVC